MLKIAVIFVSVCLGFTLSQECSHTSPCTPLKGGLAFKNPSQIHTWNQNLHVTIDVDVHDVTIDWLTVKRRLYNGEFTAPTIWIRAGERFVVTLANNLQDPDPPKPEANKFGFPNTTNLHTHGLHISSQSPRDNPVIVVEPGQQFDYIYHVHPDQQAGTFWYHPHYHGSVFFQVLGGLKGALIVEDNPFLLPQSLEAVSCPLNCEHDLQMVFSLFQYSSQDSGDFSKAQRDIGDYEGFRLNTALDNSDQTLEEWLEDPANNIRYMLVNGLLNPVLQIHPGQMKRFRLINAGEYNTLAIEVVNIIQGEPSCSVKEIAIDSIYLDVPREPRLGRTYLPPGGRADWLIVCNEVGTYEMRSTFYDEDKASMGETHHFTGPIMTIKVSGFPRNSDFPHILPPKPSFLQDLRDVPSEDIKGRFQLEMNSQFRTGRELFAGAYYRYKAEVDTVQEWYITNTETTVSHPLHIHVNSFQIISYNQYTGPYSAGKDGAWRLYDQATGDTCNYQFSGYDPQAEIEEPSDPLKYLGHEQRQDLTQEGTIAYVEPGEWRDTFTVPPMSNVTIRFVTDTYVGLVVAHCHILNHEDWGMMLAVDIVRQGESLDANLASGGAYPWSCMENTEPLGIAGLAMSSDIET
ncbi:laccase-like [Ciona intestinalis]